jgi:outer membrane protein assembly factor BamD (BamD/ComL family)
MSVKPFLSHCSPLFLVILMLLMTACNQPGRGVSSNQYQTSIESDQSEAGPVSELHNQALSALEQDNFQQAINYLQRAIKIQPRNAWSWHYLAQSYWRDGQNDRCRSMVDRSDSYSSYDEVLISANSSLRNKCQG